MSSPLKGWLALGLILSLLVPQPGVAEQAPLDLKVMVRVHNYANVDDGTLIPATQEVTRIFREIGVEMIWLHSCASSQAMPADSENTLCVKPPHLLLRVFIVQDDVRGRKFDGEGAMGLTPYGEEGKRCRLAYVFYDRVVRSSRRFQKISPQTADTAQTLAHTIAHEIGHLLLPLNSHGPIGIMRCPWGLAEFKLAAIGALNFTAEQGELIRAKVSGHTR